jgi:molecular chaperone GrpE
MSTPDTPDEQERQESSEQGSPEGTEEAQKQEAVPTDDEASQTSTVEPDERDAQLEELERQAAQYKDLFLRKAADFENFKRRTENEMSVLARFANEDLVLAFLPFVDDIERALKASSAENGNEGSLRRGVELILQKLLKVLENIGVTPMETVGKTFDVNYHDVLLQVRRPDVPAHTIIEEVERGYLMHDKVIRHAKVVVAAGPEEHAGNEESDSPPRQGSTPSPEDK